MTAPRTILPRISVVVPSYNQGRFLRTALDSIFRQGYPDLEVIVMDGGSQDDSVAIIQSFADRVKYWRSQKDGGQSAAINAGMRHCTGDLVAWLNSDDYYHGDALWTVGKAYAAFPGHGLYIGNGLRFDQASGAYAPFCSRHVALNRAALRYGTDYLLQPSVFFLRQAWQDVGGLDLTLSYCMDWDIFLRIADRYPAVAIQEFLGVSREYDETKTRSGKMKRAAEIVRMVQAHTQTEVTPGSLLFLLETLVDVAKDGLPAEVGEHLRAAQALTARRLSMRFGGGHGFPERADPQDRVYLPFASEPEALAKEAAPFANASGSDLPPISIITLSSGEAASRQATVDSIRYQAYARAESIAVDSHSNEPTAINSGMQQAHGEVVGWLHEGDLLADGALVRIGQAFANDPELDLVYGNAVSIDANGQFFLADHGAHLSGLWLGAFQPPGDWAAYGSDLYAVPQPTVFIRRRALERCGMLDDSYRHIYDYELFTRIARNGKVKKIERIQALYRVRGGNRERWNEMLVELYRLSRRSWPGVLSSRFPEAIGEFLRGYLRRRFGGRPRTASMAAAALGAAMSAITGVGNPEQWWKSIYPGSPDESSPLMLPARQFGIRGRLFVPPRQTGRYHSLYCTPCIEAWDMNMLRSLRDVSSVEMFALLPTPQALPGRGETVVDAVHTPATIAAARPDLIGTQTLLGKVRHRVTVGLRRLGLPLPGIRKPLFVTEQMPALHRFCRPAVQESLERNSPDFVFISPHTNPLALMLDTTGLDARLVWVYPQADQSAVSQVEAERIHKFERDTLTRCDAVIVTSQASRHRFVSDFGYPAERIHVLASGCDASLAGWLTLLKGLPRAQIAKAVHQTGHLLHARAA